MRANQDVQSNTFVKGMAIDPSDMVMPADTLRFGQNLRIVNHQSSSYVVTNLQGTDEAFQLTSGYKAIAAQEYANVLYIISWNETNGYLEIGSFPSPVYGSTGSSNDYRPFNNFAGPLRTDLFGTTSSEIPIIQKLEVQQDFDNSVNICFTIKDLKPRIVNSKFEAFTFEQLADRTGAASNTYTTLSIEKETSLIPYTDKILGLEYSAIESGGKLKPGNYQYVFYYMTESFNRTQVIEQSSICQIFSGISQNDVEGGDETEVTTKRVKLSLTNVDTDFRYLKVYVLYSAGQEGLQQQYLEFVQPIEITGSSMDFIHSGYEEVTETAQSEIDIDYATIQSANASTQVGGYYLLGDVKQREITYTGLRAAAANLTPALGYRTISLTGSLQGYANPENTYKYLGYTGGETYAFGVVFIMNDGSTSPVFPISSKNKTASAVNDGKGLVTFVDSNTQPPFDSTIANLSAKYITVNVSSVASSSSITDQASGFFFVRADRRPNMLTQGLLVPTMKAPVTETINSSNNFTSYYKDNKDSLYDLTVFKHLINFDSIVEGFFYDGGSIGDSTNIAAIIDSGLQTRCMPLSMRLYSFSGTSYFYGNSNQNIFSSEVSGGTPVLRHWALLSGETFVNQPEYVTSLQRDNAGLRQLMKVLFSPEAAGSLTASTNPIGYFSPSQSLVNSQYRRFAPHYKMVSFSTYSSNSQSVEKIVYVSPETFITGTDFISKLTTALRTKTFVGDADTTRGYWVNQAYNSYFGIKISGTTLTYDGGPGSSNPIGPRYLNYPSQFYIDGGPPLPAYGDSSDGIDCVSGFANYPYTYMDLFGSSLASAGFLVNIYPQQNPSAPDDLYPSIDNLTYKQVSKRYSWTSAAAISNNIPIYGGDCYISQVSRRLSQTPERNPANKLTTGDATSQNRWNIDSGLIVTWWQESKYNLHLRQQKQYDSSELEERSFFPYKTLGDVANYRKVRLPETIAHSPGYAVTSTLKSFFNISSLIVSEKTRFMNRIYHSERHIPNSFRNGYRSFLQNSYKDYDTSMGPITALFNHRGNVLVVFQHGIGIGGINQRIETGRDGAGAIFVEPTTVLPPVLTYLSREIGAQDNMTLVQTPGAVYGIDQSKKKIWVVQDNLRVISDEAQISTWLNLHPASLPASGYDISNNEVVFKTQDWTLCYSEIVGKFTSFYTMNDVDLFARRGNDFYSFIGNQAHRHNSPDIENYKLYNQGSETIVEVVVNKGVTIAKIVDYFNLVSNEVAPDKIEVYTYNQENDIQFTLTPATTDYNQYGVIENLYNDYLQMSPIVYRDRRYVVHAPVRSVFNAGDVNSYAEWDIEGRIRDKHIIIRLTYSFDETKNKPLELASILTYFRYSRS
jgi:hypothetical protein